MDCPDRTVLQAWATGREVPADEPAWADHLDACEICRAAMDEAIAATDDGGLVRGLAGCRREHERILPTLRSLLEKDFGVAGMPDWKRFPFLESIEGRIVTGRIGRLELKEWLGAGSMGAVFRAVDPALEREVAVKVLRPEYEGHPGIAALFLDEARAAAGLRHESILPIYDVFAPGGGDDGVAGYVMPLVSGGTLADRLEGGGAFDPGEWVRVLQRIAEALAAAHAAGVLHRDVKPANVLLEADGPGVWLADFGLARAAHHGYGSDSLVGTPGYAAPEIVAGGTGSVAADLHALGKVALEMACGRLPRSVEEKPALEEKSFPAWATRWIAWLTDPEPESRPTSAEEAARALVVSFESAAGTARRVASGRRLRTGLAIGFGLILVTWITDAALGWRGTNALLRKGTEKVSIDGRPGTQASVGAALAAVPGDLTIRVGNGEALFADAWPDLTDRTIEIIGDGVVKGGKPVAKAGSIRVKGGGLKLVGLDLRPRGDLGSLSGFLEIENARLVLEDCSIRKPLQNSRTAVTGGALVFLSGGSEFVATRSRFLTDRGGKAILAVGNPGTETSITLSDTGFAGGGFLHVVATDPAAAGAPGTIGVEIADSTVICSGAFRLGRNGAGVKVAVRSRNNLWQSSDVFLSAKEQDGGSVREAFVFEDEGSLLAVGGERAVEWDAAPAGGERQGEGDGALAKRDWESFLGRQDASEWVDWIVQYRPGRAPLWNNELSFEGRGGRLLGSMGETFE